MNIDDFYMAIAIKLAMKAEGATSPNPLVGAVIVKNGRIVGMGYHKRCGLAHAEINAIKAAARHAKGADMYVTLEPCDHFGRTPPCTSAIIDSGIKKVIIAMRDPNPITRGRGITRLKSHGIAVKVGVMGREAELMNRSFTKFITKRLPFITLKMAETIDGKIATKSGDSKWITGDESRAYVKKLRVISDAVMVGVDTVIKDDPSLTGQKKGAKIPVRIIVDSKLRTPLNSAIVKDARNHSVILAVTKRAISGKIDLYKEAGALLLFCRAKGRRVDLKDLLYKLASMNIANILVEGGGELAAGFIERDLVDRYLFFIAPKILGGRLAKTSVEGKGVRFIKDAVQLKDIVIKRFKSDILIEAWRR